MSLTWRLLSRLSNLQLCPTFNFFSISVFASDYILLLLFPTLISCDRSIRLRALPLYLYGVELIKPALMRLSLSVSKSKSLTLTFTGTAVPLKLCSSAVVQNVIQVYWKWPSWKETRGERNFLFTRIRCFSLACCSRIFRSCLLWSWKTRKTSWTKKKSLKPL